MIFTRYLENNYDLDQVKKIYLNADGEIGSEREPGDSKVSRMY